MMTLSSLIRCQVSTFSDSPFFAIDIIWIGWVVRPMYDQQVGGLLRANPQVGAAAVFYLMYAAGIVYFAERASDSPLGRRLVEAGGGWIFRDAAELEQLWRRWLEDREYRREASRRARQYVESGRGAAEAALDFVEKRLLVG